MIRQEQAKLRKQKEKAQRAAKKAREEIRKQKRKLKRMAKAAPKKAMAQWSAEVRGIGHCEMCGSTEHINAHHILPRERYPSLKLELMNGCCLCANCHKFSKFSAHRNPLFFVFWLKSVCPPRYRWSLKHMGLPDWWLKGVPDAPEAEEANQSRVRVKAENDPPRINPISEVY